MEAGVLRGDINASPSFADMEKYLRTGAAASDNWGQPGEGRAKATSEDVHLISC